MVGQLWNSTFRQSALHSYYKYAKEATMGWVDLRPGQGRVLIVWCLSCPLCFHTSEIFSHGVLLYREAIWWHFSICVIKSVWRLSSSNLSFCHSRFTHARCDFIHIARVCSFALPETPILHENCKSHNSAKLECRWPMFENRVLPVILGPKGDWTTAIRKTVFFQPVITIVSSGLGNYGARNTWCECQRIVTKPLRESSWKSAAEKIRDSY